MTVHRLFIDRTMAFNEGIGWTTVRGIYPDAYVPEAALLDAQAEIARLTAALERTEANRDAILADLAEVTAERDTARAETAMMVELAAQCVMDARIGDADNDLRSIFHNVESLTPAHATSALDARDRAKVAEGLRMALNLMDAALSQPQIGTAREIVRIAILSRAKDMEAGNG